MKRGYTQVYTGNGKGKTTASIGLMLRAAGAGYRIYWGQFMKKGDYSETKIIRERFPEITLEQFGGTGFLINREAREADIQNARDGWQRAYDALVSGAYDLVVLDEMNVALHLGLLTLPMALQLIEDKPVHTELVLTGRNAHPDILAKADLVTEMTEIKHYFHAGAPARTGIEM